MVISTGLNTHRRGENLGTLENTKKNEVIPSYARKSKSAHDLPW